MRKLKTRQRYDIMSLESTRDINDVLSDFSNDVFTDLNEFYGNYDDLQFEASSSRMYSPSGKAVYDYVNGGVLFKSGAVSSDYIIIVCQIPHRWAVGTPIYPHIHWVQTSSGVINWRMKYRWYNNGGLIPSFGSAISGNNSFQYSSGSMLQITNFGEIDAGDNGISSFVDVMIYRETPDGLAGDVLLKQFDFHIRNDSSGSRDEYVKEQ